MPLLACGRPNSVTTDVRSFLKHKIDRVVITPNTTPWLLLGKHEKTVMNTRLSCSKAVTMGGLRITEAVMAGPWIGCVTFLLTF